MVSDSIKLENLYIEMNFIRRKIDDEIVPVDNYLGGDNLKLIIALKKCLPN